MLDVHPPHEAAHTWKDFFIHVATICVGLLIAIGLEQAVEAVHHQLQRQELVRNLTVEAEDNVRGSEEDLDALAAYRRWSEAAYRQMLLTPVEAPLILPPFPDVGMQIAEGQEWHDALSSGEVDVLPPILRAHYAVSYYFYDRVTQFESQGGTNFYTLDTLLGPVPRTKDGGFDLTKLNSEQRKPLLETIVRFRSDALGSMRQIMFLEAYSSLNQHAVSSADDVWKRKAREQIGALMDAYPELQTRLSDKPSNH